MSYLLTDDDAAPVEDAEAAVIAVLEDDEVQRDSFDMSREVMKILLAKGWTPPVTGDPQADVDVLARVMDPGAFADGAPGAMKYQRAAIDHARKAVEAGWHSPASVAKLEDIVNRREEQSRRLITARNDARNALRELANKSADALVAAHIIRLAADEPGFSGPNNFYAGARKALAEAMNVLGVTTLGAKNQIARQVLDGLDQSDV